jgi:hypothetical protein
MKELAIIYKYTRKASLLDPIWPEITDSCERTSGKSLLFCQVCFVLSDRIKVGKEGRILNKIKHLKSKVGRIVQPIRLNLNKGPLPSILYQFFTYR